MSSRAQDRLNLDLDRWRLMVDNDLDALEATAKKLVEADERQAARADRNGWLLVTTAIGFATTSIFFAIGRL